MKRFLYSGSIAALVLVPMTLFLIAGSTNSSEFSPHPSTITLIWEYPEEQLGTDLIFKVYASGDLSVPFTNWNLLTSVIGTNLSLQLPVNPGANFFTITAFRNGLESYPATPAPE